MEHECIEGASMDWANQEVSTARLKQGSSVALFLLVFGAGKYFLKVGGHGRDPRSVSPWICWRYSEYLLEIVSICFALLFLSKNFLFIDIELHSILLLGSYITFYVSLVCLKTQGFQYSGAFAAMGVDNSVSVEKFCKNFKIEINRLTEDDMEFDMIGIDASIANAFRRILIAEVFVCFHAYNKITKNFLLYFSTSYVSEFWINKCLI
jgi:hypothetical protein